MESTEIPTICCMLQRLGSGLGQDGSTRYCGAPLASRAWRGITCAYPTDPAACATKRNKPTLAAVRILVMGVSPCCWPSPMATSPREISTLRKLCRDMAPDGSLERCDPGRLATFRRE